jgi:hypothetical protein
MSKNAIFLQGERENALNAMPNQTIIVKPNHFQVDSHFRSWKS